MDNQHHKSEGFSVIPKGEAKCIWMMAGMISYKLCDRDHQCENCPLDIELRRARNDNLVPGNRIVAERDGEVDDRGFLFYYPNHTWVRMEGANNAVIGLDDFIIRIFSRIKRFVLPKTGAQIEQGEGLALVIQDEATFIVTSPLSGRIKNINGDLMVKSYLMTENPGEMSWLVDLLPTKLDEIRGLLVGKKSLAWQQEESGRLDRIVQTLHDEQRERLGAVMHDGKGKLDALHEIVGTERYYQILNSFLQVKK